MIIDLHCDLLGSIEQNPNLTFDSPGTNCSLPQLKEGGVTLQTLAVAAITRRGSARIAERQVELYKKMPRERDYIFAIENASALVEENEPLEQAFKRFETFREVEKILYVSLTWNDENRFGGGNASTIGLKPDGERFLEYLSQTPTTIDLSHTSDALAYDILNFIDKHSLSLTPIASHSNFRAIKDVPRNLPDDLAQEIIRRGGLIGINFVRRFVGDAPEDFLRHIDHALSLGAENTLALGADFYGGISVPCMEHPVFQPNFNNSSCYPAFFALLRSHLSDTIVDKIAYKNATKSLLFKDSTALTPKK